jgi:hypothetical protein
MTHCPIPKRLGTTIMKPGRSMETVTAAVRVLASDYIDHGAEVPPPLAKVFSVA